MSGRWTWPKVAGCLVLAVVLAFAALTAVVMGLHELAAGEEGDTRSAWSESSPLGDLDAPPPERPPNGAALRLEENAALVGLVLAPRGSDRAARLAAGAPGAPVLAALHAELLRQLGDAPPAIAPDVAAWLDQRGPALDALSAEALALDVPRWESPAGRTIARVPEPLARADRLVREAGRLAELGEAGLGESDEHLTRPGVPRLDRIALLDEALVLLALRKAREGDGQAALRALSAAARIEEGLAADADPIGLGVLANLARTRLAAVRAVGLPVDAAPLLGPALEPRVRPALMAESAAWARAIASTPPIPAPRDGFVKHVRGAIFGSIARAQQARTLRNLRRIVEAAEGPQPSDAQLDALLRDATSASPAWDGVQADYLEGLVLTWRRARRADMDAELTRRFLRARQALVATGDPRAACQIAVGLAADRSAAAFACKADERGRLAIVVADAPASVGEPDFDPPPRALIAP